MKKFLLFLLIFFLFSQFSYATYETFNPQQYAQKNGFFEMPLGYNVTDYSLNYTSPFENKPAHPQIFLNALNKKFGENKVQALLKQDIIRGIQLPEKGYESLYTNPQGVVFLNMKISIPQSITDRTIRYYPVDYRSGLWYRAGWDNTIGFPRLNFFNEASFLPSFFSISATQSGSSLISKISYSLKYKFFYLPEVFILQGINISAKPSSTIVVVPYYEFHLPKGWKGGDLMFVLSGYGTTGFYGEMFAKDGKAVLPVEYK